MNANTYTLHRQAAGGPDDIRVVPDGFRLSVFLLPPAALLARGLWGAALGWLLFVAACCAAAYAGVLSPSACIAAIFVLHVVLAIDAANLERRRLARRGWPVVAMVGPFGTVPAAVTEFPRASVAGAPNTAGDTSVIGLFPS